MDEESKVQQEIERLTRKINKYNKAFFQEGKSLVSDYVYDQLMQQLVAYETEFPQLKREDSPTQRIGEAPSRNFPTLMHKYPMHSLSNTYQEEEVKQFIARVHKNLGETSVAFICELKIDGLALNIVYRQGTLQHVITRGNGQQGDDITANKWLISHIPARIRQKNVPDFLEIRGEAFMPKQVFDNLNKRHKEDNKPLLANPRNAAAGMLRSKYISKSLFTTPPLGFCPYALLAEQDDVLHQSEALNLLASWGFSVPSHHQYCPSIQEIMQYIHTWQKKRAHLPMDTDGVVIKVNSFKQQKKLGATAKSPRWAVAYKYKPDSAETILKDVMYQVGRTGVITPVAILKPVLLARTVVKRASLYNAQEITRLNLYINDSVFIEKGGDIIPKVMGVNKDKRNPLAIPVTFPTQCPACDSKLVQNAGEAQHYCPNQVTCLPQRKGSIVHFLHKKAMDITFLGPKTVDLLFDQGLIKRPVDLFYLRAEHLRGLDGFQEKMVNNLLQGIEHAKKVPFERVLFGLGIRHIGTTVAHKLATHFYNIDALMMASKEKLLEIPEVGEKIADSIITYFKNPESRQQIEELRAIGLSFQIRHAPKTSSLQKLSEQTFIVSGTLQKYNRQQVHTYIRDHGGIIATTMSSRVTFLVAGVNPSPSKVRKAQELNVPIISEEALESMVE